jgi:hypothetical protein
MARDARQPPRGELSAKDRLRRGIMGVISGLESRTVGQVLAENDWIEKGKAVLGVRKLRKQDPFDSPDSAKKSHSPISHSACEVLKKNFKAAIKRIRAAHADASAAFRYGKTDIKFPPHTFCSFRFYPD